MRPRKIQDPARTRLAERPRVFPELGVSGGGETHLGQVLQSSEMQTSLPVLELVEYVEQQDFEGGFLIFPLQQTSF